MECAEHQNSICRVCSKCVPTIHKNGASIFYKTDDVFIYEKLNIIANVDIKPDDGLPDRICIECLLELHNAILFKHKCENSNNILLSALYTNIETSTKEPAVDDDKLEDEHYTDHDDVAEEPHTPTVVHIKYEPEDEKLQSEEEDVQPVQQTNTERTSNAIDLKLECHDCGEIFRTKCKLRVHWKREHLKEYLTCDKCKRVFSSFKTLHNHKQKNSKLCTIIQNTFRIEGTGKLSKFHCKHCEYSTSNRCLLKNHVRKHRGEKRYQCDLCPMSYFQKGGLRSHKEYKHQMYLKEGPCGICGEYIQGAYKLSHHMNKKHGKKVKEVSCEICHKVYKSKHILKEHMNRHIGKTYSCDVCFKTFTAASNVYAHKKHVHVKNAVHICPICGYKNHRADNIKIHISKHNGTNCACIVCGRFSENEVQLSLHKQRHNDRNYKCTQCDKTFFRRKIMIQHVHKVHKINSLNMNKNVQE